MPVVVQVHLRGASPPQPPHSHAQLMGLQYGPKWGSFWSLCRLVEPRDFGGNVIPGLLALDLGEVRCCSTPTRSALHSQPGC
jgi:hypothetical protein